MSTANYSSLPTNIYRQYMGFGGRGSDFASDHFFGGTIAYLRFWHGEALDAGQVAELYAALIEPTPAPTTEPTPSSTSWTYGK